MEDKIKTPDIKINHFSFDRKILAFTVMDYMLKQKDQSKLGQMKVHIQVKDKDGRSLFDQEKTLTAREHETKISLGNFKAIKTGEYDFLINAQDLFTGKEANLHQKIKVKH